MGIKGLNVRFHDAVNISINPLHLVSVSVCKLSVLFQYISMVLTGRINLKVKGSLSSDQYLYSYDLIFGRAVMLLGEIRCISLLDYKRLSPCFASS